MVKVRRTFPAPQSLQEEAKKENGTYALQDVVCQLKQDFNEKCYICEMKDLQDPQIEHLLPHQKGKYQDRKFDWENLFWSCGHCNNVKNQKKYEEGIIDCCNVDPENYLVFGIENHNVKVKVRDDSKEEAGRTAELVEEVFNLRNTGMRIYKSELRFTMLQSEMNVLYTVLGRYRKNRNSPLILKTLRGLLKRESAFAGFKRCYVREHAKEYPELMCFLE